MAAARGDADTRFRGLKLLYDIIALFIGDFDDGVTAGRHTVASLSEPTGCPACTTKHQSPSAIAPGSCNQTARFEWLHTAIVSHATF